MMLDVGKKVIVNNETFQVLENDKHELTLYKINVNGEKEEAVLDYATFKKVAFELSGGKTGNVPVEEKKPLKKVNLPRKLICLGLALSNTLVGLALATDHISLKNSESLAIVEDDDFYNMIRNNDNISAELKPFVRNFAERTSQVFPEYNDIYDNLDDIQFEVNQEYFDTNSELSSASAVYLNSENKIIYDGGTPIYNFINHELFHSGSPKFSQSCDKYGKSLVEGVTAQLEWELFGTTSYGYNRKVAKMVALIIGGDKLCDIYFEGELVNLEKEITKYCDAGEFENILIETDSLNQKKKTSVKDYEDIYNFYIDTFFEKLNQDILMQKSITKESYSELIGDIAKFEKIDLDNNNKEYFTTKLSDFNKNMSDKFDEIKNYEKLDSIKSQKEYYSNLEEDEISYISGALSYHYTTTINNQNDASQSIVLSTEVGANKEYINTYSNILPDDSITTVQVFNAAGNHIETYFNDVQYYIDEALIYNSTFENSETEELVIRSSGCEYVKTSDSPKTKTYSLK